MKVSDNTLTSYNKNDRTGPGILIHNWWEERELKDATGVDRTIPQHHQSKNSKDLYNKTLNLDEVK